MQAEDHPSAQILIVDDEEANVLVLERMLQRAGYTRLLSTTDSRRALPLFQENAPDLVLLDLLMPYLDGYAVMEQLREHTQEGDFCPILVLTADVTREAVRRALASGANDFLTKPFDQTELLLRVKNLLDTRFLYQGLQLQAARLQQLTEEMQQSMRERDQSLSAISHDIGQPLAALRMTADLLHQEMNDGPAPDRKQIADEVGAIELAAGQLAMMLGELSDLARLQMGRELVLQRQPLDLVALVRAEVESQRRTSGRQIRLSPAVPELNGNWDRMRLVRVVSNLIGNAVKYSPARRGAIEVTVAPSTRDGEAWAEVTVRDQGMGIPADDLPHVFSWFHRASNVTGKIPGTGIGLAAAKQIIEQHGGSIELQSEEGKGTLVTVRLPLEADA